LHRPAADRNVGAPAQRRRRVMTPSFDRLTGGRLLLLLGALGVGYVDVL
jgi:hypothetical protein